MNEQPRTPEDQALNTTLNAYKTRFLRVLGPLFVCTLLIGCLGSGSDDSAETQPSDDINGELLSDDDDDISVGDGPANVSVPASYISQTDSTNTAQAVRGGINPYDELISDTFSCFDEDANTVVEADLQLIVSGSTYSTPVGNGTIRPSEDFGDIEFIGGPLDDESSYVNFDEFGQRFAVDYGRLDLECFQHGASLDRVRHRFLLNTPEPASYQCRDVQSNDVQILTLSNPTQAGGQYSTADGSGTYTLSDRIDGSSSRLEFTGGPLNSDGVWYRENADTGRQSFRISETRSFGIAVASSSSLTYVCARNRSARPFKMYGSGTVENPARPSVALKGQYYVSDIQTSVNSSYLRADIYHFREDGYVARGSEGSIGHDCDRTAPNGLNYCDSYDIQGGRLIITGPTGRTEEESDIELSSGSTVTEIDGTTAELVTRSPSTLDGVWSNNSYSSSGCFGFGFCSFSYTERILRFNSEGRFIKQSSGQSGSDFSTALGSSSAFATSSNDSTGSYQIVDNRLLLSYDNGDSENSFIYRTVDGDLVVEDLLYPPGDLSD